MDSIRLANSHDEHFRSQFFVKVLNHLDLVVEWKRENKKCVIFGQFWAFSEYDIFTLHKRRVLVCHLTDPGQRLWAQK